MAGLLNFIKFPNTVVNFHVIKNQDWMENILKLLGNHFEFIGLEEMESFYYEGKPQKNKCHITVDDGDITVYTHLLPLVKKHKIPISIYVSPTTLKEGKNFWFQEIRDYDLAHFLGFFNKKFGKRVQFEGKGQVYALLKALTANDLNQLILDYKTEFGIADKPRMGMDLQQVMELKQTGLFDIGAHTFNHPILKNESDASARHEIVDCVDELGGMLGEKVKWFAYPNGVPRLDFSNREFELLKEAGIRLAFSTENKRFSMEDNPLSIPRTGISKGNSLFIVAKMAMGSEWEKWKATFNRNKEVEIRSNVLVESSKS